MTSKPALEGVALRNAIRDIASRHLDLSQYEVFIFGSEVGASAPRGADIDVGIKGPEAVPGRTLQHLRDDLEKLRTLRIFDVVDFSRADKTFTAVALQNVERL